MELPKGIMLGILLFTILFINVNGAGPLKLGAFNIKMFGWSKYSTSWTKKVIQQVICQYDIIFIQDIVNASILQNFVDDINTLETESCHDDYKVVHSTPLGCGEGFDEVYAYIYSAARVTVISSETYNDTNSDKFLRPPFVIKITGNEDTIWHIANVSGEYIPITITLIGLNARAGNLFLKDELDALADVYDYYFNTDNSTSGARGIAYIIGDLKANCSYIFWSTLKDVKIYPDKNSTYSWLLNEYTNIHTEPKRCKYDRLIAVGNIALQCYLAESARVNMFDNFIGDTAIGMMYGTDYLLKYISDHYPVEMLINCAN